MEIVGAALGDHVDHAAAGASAFGAIGAGRDLEFLHRILAETIWIAAGAGATCSLPEEYGIGIRPIDLKTICSAALSAGREIAAARRIADDAGSAQSEMEGVAG